MNIGITKLTDNLAFSFETIVLLLASLGSLIFAAKDFRLGVIVLMVSSGLCFMWFYYVGYYWPNALVVFFISFLVLSFTLYATLKTSQQGSVI